MSMPAALGCVIVRAARDLPGPAVSDHGQCGDGAGRLRGAAAEAAKAWFIANKHRLEPLVGEQGDLFDLVSKKFIYGKVKK